MDGYHFSRALGLVYEFIWHRFADYYIEQLKDGVINGNIEARKSLESIYLENLKMLHPFIPFVTEAVWKGFEGEESSILLELLWKEPGDQKRVKEEQSTDFSSEWKAMTAEKF